MTSSSGGRLRPAIILAGTVALAVALLGAAPANGASPAACRVKNLRTGVVAGTLQAAVKASRNGDRLTVKGTCHGITTIKRSLDIRGVRTTTSGTPTLDGDDLGSVVTIGPTARVSIRSLTIRDGRAFLMAPLSAPAALLSSGDGGGIDNRGTLTLTGVVVRGSEALGEAGSSGGRGGGVVNTGTLTLKGTTTIRDNQAAYCGGVANDGTLVLNGSSEIRRNHAGSIGGGVCNNGTMVLNDRSLVRANGDVKVTKAVRRSMPGATLWSSGGGVANDGTLRLNDASSITGNVADIGGGVYSTGLVVLKESSTVAANEARVRGGGIATDGSVVRLNQGSAVAGNTVSGPGETSGDGGGGIHLGPGSLLVTRHTSLVTDNHTESDGGGIFNRASIVRMWGKSLVRRNTTGTGGSGGGVLNWGGPFELHDSSAIRKNTAFVGGGMFNAGLMEMADASEIAHNTATLHAGGISLHSGAGNAIGVVCGGNVHDNQPEDCGPQP